MRNINLSNSKNIYAINNRISIMELILGLGFISGFFMLDTTMNIIFYIFSLVVQIYACANYIKQRVIYIKNNGELTPFFKYLLGLFFVFLIFLCFYCIKVEPAKIVNRIFPLIAIFGVIIVGNKQSGIDCNNVIRVTTVGFSIESLLINIDFMRYILTGDAMWPPQSYLGLRSIGTFGDPNFLSVYAFVFLIIVIYQRPFTSKINKIITISIIFNIITAGSLSTFMFIIMTVVIHFIFNKNRTNNIIKQITILSIYFAIIGFYMLYKEQIESIGINILKHIYDNIYSAIIKYESLRERLDVQSLSLNIFCQEWWGQGPRQTVPMLGRDTHNSYFGIMFEEGIFGLFLIFVTLKKKVTNRAGILMGTFIMLSALMLNVHLCSVYSIFLVFQYVSAPARCTIQIQKKKV